MARRAKQVETRVGRVRVYQEPGRAGWYIRWTDPLTGKNHKHKAGEYDDACQLALDKHNSLEAHRLGLLKNDDPGLDLRVLLDDYVRYKARHNISELQVKAVNSQISRAFDWLGAVCLKDIERRAIERFLDHLQDGGLSTRTLNKYQDAIKSLFHWALTEGRIKSNPLFGLKPRKGPQVRRRKVFSDAEMQSIFAAAKRGPSWQTLAVAMGYYAAMRLREVRGLQWGRVHFTTKEIELRPEDQKNKRHSFIQLANPLVDLLKKAYKAAADTSADALVLPGIPKDPSAHQRALLKRARIDYIDKLKCVGDFHAFRHTCLTRMGESGMPLAWIQDFARHSKPETTRIYVRENKDGMRKAAACLPALKG